LVRFVLLPGQHHDLVSVRPLIEGVAFGALLGDEGVAFGALLGDKAFDADWLRADLDDRGAAAVIPPKVNRRTVLTQGVGRRGWRAAERSARAPPLRGALEADSLPSWDAPISNA
jgi:hypothetical protein